MKKQIVTIANTALTMGQARDEICALAYSTKDLNELIGWFIAVTTVFKGAELEGFLNVYSAEYTRISREALNKGLVNHYYTIVPMKG